MAPGRIAHYCAGPGKYCKCDAFHLYVGIEYTGELVDNFFLNDFLLNQNRSKQCKRYEQEENACRTCE